MSSLFARALCCCCLRPRSKSPAFDDERSRLIPPESEVPSYAQPHPIVIDHQKLKERLGEIVRTKEGKMLNVGASSPLNLHREVLQTRLNPSASNSSRSVTGHHSFYSSNKSVTSDDHCATDLEGGSSHHTRLIPQNPSLASFRTEEASPSRDGHDHGRDPPTVLNIRLASSGVYDSERNRRRGRSGQRIANTYVNVASEDGEGKSRSSAPSHTSPPVSRSRSPSPSRTRPEALIKDPVAITRSWKDE